MENGMFARMHAAAAERLCGCDPDMIARNADVSYCAKEHCFIVPSLGRELMVDASDYTVRGTDDGWLTLLVLQYLAFADGLPLRNRPISLSEMAGGLARGSDFDRRCERDLRKLMQGCSEERLLARCRELGGVQTETNADISVILPFFPRFPILLKIWRADEEFPASGKILVDASAEHYLSLEGAVAAGEMILAEIARAL